MTVKLSTALESAKSVERARKGENTSLNADLSTVDVAAACAPGENASPPPLRLDERSPACLLRYLFLPRWDRRKQLVASQKKTLLTNVNDEG